MPQNVHNHKNVNKLGVVIRNLNVFCKSQIACLFSFLAPKIAVLELCFVSKENTLF